MTISDHDPTLRERVDELGERLARISASAATLRNLAGDIRQGVPPSALLTLTDALDRDLLLASRELQAVRARATYDLARLRHVQRTT
jgi:hypothetical protein